eukprot:CAMPEP_0172555392 /NCGR_PEP_ID=MMETSP1067-20121228/58392_1 /TAXON_ID=265564 ORGANISM="Thalassiosira punctigera, Strain Tpunct2005C2" /NCGR_SAMPLE_ID=MMETSP1067 /ASSEMBLY_ACC=CAM_ASM_000444 /LENGTH=277 /DNA_ID=CAMNT_0013343909 /DNA_START=22 /DNA_END=855 /DNA_ORIENTATION=+
MLAKPLPQRTSAFASPFPQQRRSITRSRDCRITPIARFVTIDDSLLSPSFAESTSSTTPLASSGITPIQEFEPVLNTEAAASFVIIAIVFTLFQLRINAVSSAARRRSSALEALRKTESLQLSASDVGVDPLDRPTEEQVQRAKNEYERALREEIDLRTIMPGVRIVAPNDPKRDKEEMAAAKRFLGWGSEEFGEVDSEDVAIGNNGVRLEGSDGNGSFQKKQSDEGLSNSANFLLLGVASMLIVLLWTLSFDPMVADQVFTTLGGSSLQNIPLTSW